MARVLVARQPWGTLWEKAADRKLSVPASGTGASINTTVYSAATGSGTVASFVTNTDGELPGWVEEGTYTLTVNGVATQVEATSGLVGTTGIGSTATQGGTVAAPAEKQIWRFQPVDTAKAPFTWHIHGASFNGTWDTVMYLGYNCAGAGGRVSTTEPSFRFVIEQDYEHTEGQTHWLEAYWEWVSANGLQQKRPIFWRFDRTTGDMVGFEIRAKGVSFTDWGTDAEIAKIDDRTGTFRILGHASQTGTSQIVVTAQNSQQVAISLSGVHGGWGLDSLANQKWAMRVAGAAIQQMSESAAAFCNSDLGQNASVCVQSFDPVKTAWSTLKTKKIVGQTQPLFEVASDTNALYSKFDHDGYFMTRKTAAPADASLVAGELALWFDQTNGAAKLMVKAKQADGVVRTGSVALA